MNTMESLVSTFLEGHPRDAAVAFEKTEVEDALRTLRKLPVRGVALLMERLTPHRAGAILGRLDGPRTREIFAAMSPREAPLVLSHFEEDQREQILKGLPPSMHREFSALLEYLGDTAGGMMEPRVASIPSDLTVQGAIAVLRKAPRQTLYYLYVTDREGKLVGVLNMRDLMLASPHTGIESLVRRPVHSVPATMASDEVLNMMRRYRFVALPVVDIDERLLGVIKHDEALRASQQGIFEDFQKMVGAGGDERALSPVSRVVKCRLPWLYVNLLTAFLAASVVGLFEVVIQQVTALAVLLPVVSGQGGNTGA
jgi:magnesium transporter